MELLNIDEMTGMLKCSSRAVRLWVSLGKLPKPIKLGRRAVRWDKAEVEAFLKDGAQKIT